MKKNVTSSLKHNNYFGNFGNIVSSIIIPNICITIFIIINIFVIPKI